MMNRERYNKKFSIFNVQFSMLNARPTDEMAE